MEFIQTDRRINKQRFIVVGVVHNQQGEILLCKTPPKRGVFPDQWGLPGGGIEAGETIEEALRRELREEIGIEIAQIKPLFFTDGLYTKLFPDGDRQEIYMVFLLFNCLADCDEITLNAEFEAYAWVNQDRLIDYDLNIETQKTFHKAGLLKINS